MVNVQYSGFVSMVEWIYDPTVEHVETYLLSSAPTYNSSLDSESKSILHSLLQVFYYDRIPRRSRSRFVYESFK